MARMQSRTVSVVCKVETTYGTDASPTPSTDGIYLFDTTNPLAVDTSMVDLNPLQTSLTKATNAVGRQLQRYTGKHYLQGHNNGGSPALRFAPLFRAMGMQMTESNSSSITFAPRTTGHESATIDVYLAAVSGNPIRHKLTGARGSGRISGSAGQPIALECDLTGLYNTPAITALSGFSAGSNLVETMKSITATITDGTGAYTPVFKSFNFDIGHTADEDSDALASDGLGGLYINTRNPTLELVVAADNASGSGTVQWFADLRAGTTHNVTFKHGSAAGKYITFDFPQAQLQSVDYGDENNFRTCTLRYLLTHTTAESEYSILFT